VDQAYNRLWKQLLREKRAFRSNALGVALLAAQKRLINRRVHGHVIDLGAGDLSYKAIIAAHADRYIALDIQTTHPELDCLANGERLPFAGKTIDTIFCSEVMEHTPHPWRMMQEISRVLAPDGYLLLFVPFMYYLHGEPHDYYRFSHYSLKNMLAENDLEIIESGSIGGLVVFIGMLFQNLWLLVTYNLPGLRWLSWTINRGFNAIIKMRGRPLDLSIGRDSA
jgi:SAM-dependent methyltransferase